MPASVKMLTDIKTVVTNGPNAATVAKAIAAAGEIQDYVGNTTLVITKLQEAINALTRLLEVTDAADSVKPSLTGTLSTIVGPSGGPSGILTTMKLAYIQGPSAASATLAIAAAGPIMDYSGMLKLVVRYLEEVSVLLTSIVSVTDSTDSTNLTLLQGLQSADT